MTRPVDLFRCPLCVGFAVRFGTEQHDLAVNAMADHLAFCPGDIYRTDRRLTRQLEQETDQ